MGATGSDDGRGATMSPRRQRDRPARLTLLGRFAVFEGDDEVHLAEMPQRIVALLALHGRPMRRELVAASLWPETDNAASRLRTNLYRLRRASDRLVVPGEGNLRLADTVAVDHARAVDLGRRLAESDRPATVGELDPAVFEHPLLPGWYDDWLEHDREAYEQLRFGALEGIARRCIDAARTDRAVWACLLVIRAEPYRESAHRLLAEAHAAAGNPIEALRQLDRYVDLVEREMSAGPSRLMIDLREGLRSALR